MSLSKAMNVTFQPKYKQQVLFPERSLEIIDSALSEILTQLLIEPGIQACY